MPIDQKVIDRYLNTHQSHYVGKYKYGAGYQSGDYAYRCHYYMYDETFQKIDIYVDIAYQDEISYSFSENIHDLEQEYIIKDVLNHICERLNKTSMLHYSLYDQFVKNAKNQSFNLYPIDYFNILQYMIYHKKLSQKTIDAFYDLFIPCLEALLEEGSYSTYLESLNIILKNILYEHSWDGINNRYLDTQYQYHLYYIREIIKKVDQYFMEFSVSSQEELKELLEILFNHPRFTFMAMSDFGSLVLNDYPISRDLLEELKETFVLNDKDEERENVNLVFSYIYYLEINDYEQFKDVLLDIMRNIINMMLAYANSDMDLALGNSIIKMEGYEILLELFRRDYNSFIFTCFPISSFPEKMIPTIRRELEAAIQFFAARMENDKYRMSSFEQVANINRLLIDNFGGWYK